MKYTMLKLASSGYPQHLTQLHDSPSQLYVLGELDALLNRPIVAIVGTRKPTIYAKAVIDLIVPPLINAGVVIVSGLAMGVDGLAHKATVAAGGQTIAVLPSGFNKIYPSIHSNLAKQIAETGGALVTEYEPNYLPKKYDFIARNRIIAALANAVIIPEAAARSGSIHTANFALELGRPVLAAPGNITNYLSEGTNNLIKLGAKPLTSAADVFEELGITPDSLADQIVGANKEESLLIELVRSGISDGSILLLESKLDQLTFQRTLSFLEISGKFKCLGNNYWVLA